MNQKTALEILKMGYNAFLTGPAGSGKTYILNQYIEYLRSKNIAVAKTASTGIAATHLNGKTIHSWSGLGVKDTINKKDLEILTGKRQLKKRIRKTKVLIIDEISMLHANQLDSINHICRYIRRSPLPFGGMQVVFCGDFFQLPPVQRRGGAVSFAYDSEIWNSMDIKVCYLDEQHRHKDSGLIKVLNDIRNNTVDRTTREIVNSCRNRTFPNKIRPAKLFTHNYNVDSTNDQELMKIPEKTFLYTMQEFGRTKLVEALKKSCLAPEKLFLKKGAHVMFVKNSFEENYVNGTQGKIVGFEEEAGLPIVRTTQDIFITAKPSTWIIEEDDQIIASIKQIPLRLAWAITVHKSQGMSLDAAEIDLGAAFEFGMGYVALSRVKTLSGLCVSSLNDMTFRVHADAYEKDQEFIRLSKKSEQEIIALTRLQKRKAQKLFVGEEYKRSGIGKIFKTYSIDELRKKFPQAYKPWTPEEDERLRACFHKGKSVREISRILERKPGAIRSRLIKLGMTRNT